MKIVNTLKFMIAPGVHWPDTMFTYIKEDNIICTCDFLGAHYPFDNVFAEPSKELEKSAKKFLSGKVSYKQNRKTVE